MAAHRSLWKGLGETTLERGVRLALLAAVFLVPLAAVLILSESRAEIAGRYNQFAAPKLYPLEGLIFGTSLAWLWLRRPTLAQLMGFWWLAVPVAVAFLSVLWAPDPVVALTQAIHLGAGLALLVMLAAELRDARFAVTLAWTVTAAAALQAVWGISQFVVQHDLGLQRLGESVLAPDRANVAKIPGESGPLIRAYGSLPHPNVLAVLLATGIFWVGTVLWWPWRRRPKLAQAALGVLLAVLAIGLLLTFSRTVLAVTLVNALLAIAFFYQRWHRVPPAALLAGTVTLAATLLLWPQLQARGQFESAQETGLSNRQVGLELAGAMAADRPGGVGAGNFVQAIGEFRSEVADYQHQPVHNALALVAAELGPVMAALVAMFVVRLGWIYHFQRVRDRRRNTVNLALFLLAGVFVAAGMTDHFLWSLAPGIWLAAILTAAILSRIPERQWLAAPQRTR